MLPTQFSTHHYKILKNFINHFHFFKNSFCFIFPLSPYLTCLIAPAVISSRYNSLPAATTTWLVLQLPREMFLPRGWVHSPTIFLLVLQISRTEEGVIWGKKHKMEGISLLPNVSNIQQLL